MESEIHKNQSKAKKIRILLKTYDKTFGNYQEMANFQEPILFMMRNTRKVEFFDNATTGWFMYNHTDGTSRKLKLSPEFLHTFDYGKRTFKGYVCHEDHPTPLPSKPEVTAEQFQWAIDKTQQDLINHKAKELTARGDMWWKILLGVGALILAFALAKMLVPNLFNFAGKKAVETLVENTTAIARNISIY